MTITIEIKCQTCRKVKKCPYIDAHAKSRTCYCEGWTPSIEAKRNALRIAQGRVEEEKGADR